MSSSACASRPCAGTGARRRILVVDDLPENLTVLGGLLQNEGYQVSAANSGRQALRYAAQHPHPDLILLDVMMPGMDGYEVLRCLRAMPRVNEVPVIFVTARDDAEDEEYGIELGAADYITKPIRPSVVLARVHSQLLAKEARDGLRNRNLLLEDEVSRRMHENERIQELSIRALAHLAETRDNETGNHILRTQAYVHLLANQLAGKPRFASTLTPHYIELLQRSAPLHDIGKVGIPDHILLKPGPLTPEEWEVMKTHTTLGCNAIARALRDVEKPPTFLELAMEIARSHHERWDGGGYPDGLAGESIPLSARIMAVADVFDALISPRVYKAAIPFDLVPDILAAERARQFDPDVLDTFLAKFPAFVAIARRHSDETH